MQYILRSKFYSECWMFNSLDTWNQKPKLRKVQANSMFPSFSLYLFKSFLFSLYVLNVECWMLNLGFLFISNLHPVVPCVLYSLYNTFHISEGQEWGVEKVCIYPCIYSVEYSGVELRRRRKKERKGKWKKLSTFPRSLTFELFSYYIYVSMYTELCTMYTL